MAYTYHTVYLCVLISHLLDRVRKKRYNDKSMILRKCMGKLASVLASVDHFPFSSVRTNRWRLLLVNEAKSQKLGEISLTQLMCGLSAELVSCKKSNKTK